MAVYKKIFTACIATLPLTLFAATSQTTTSTTDTTSTSSITQSSTDKDSTSSTQPSKICTSIQSNKDLSSQEMKNQEKLNGCDIAAIVASSVIVAGGATAVIIKGRQILAAKQLANDASELDITPDRLSYLMKQGFNLDELKVIKTAGSNGVSLESSSPQTLRSFQKKLAAENEYTQKEADDSTTNDELDSIQDKINDANDALKTSIDTDNLLAEANELGMSPGALQAANELGITGSQIKALEGLGLVDAGEASRMPASTLKGIIQQSQDEVEEYVAENPLKSTASIIEDSIADGE